MLSLMAAVVLAQATTWQVTTMAGTKPLVGEQSVSLASGWVCQVSAPSGGGGRSVRCSMGEARAEVSVQCSTKEKRDRAQLRLGTGSKQDYIEVSCSS